MALTRRKERRPSKAGLVDFGSRIVVAMASSYSFPARLLALCAGRLIWFWAMTAARWIAGRIRRYVPQRQILPFIASSISVSVGLGVVASSAEADIICPAWQ